LRLRPSGTAAVAPGDIIEAVGFPAMSECSVQLEDVVFRVVGHTALPAPYGFSANLDLKRDASTAMDATRVRFRATVSGIFRQDGHWALELVSGDQRTIVLFPTKAMPPPQAQPGSEIELTGICDLHLSEHGRQIGYTVDSLQFLLNEPSDLVVLRSAPWWTTGRLLMTLASMFVALWILGALVFWFRRTNFRLRAEMAARAHAEHRLSEERHRVAADLHDTLEQTLLGVDLQMDATSKTFETRPTAARTYLMLARQLLARGRQEVRSAVWDLHTEQLQQQNLAVLLEKAAGESTAGTGTAIEVTTSGIPHPLPALVASHLVRLTREASTNAAKHARPRHLSVKLEFTASLLTLTIEDDGCGFDPATSPGSSTGHFGISGMKERLARLGGTFALQSQPGQGTRVIATVPLALQPASSP
jgi:signal transduction histidine kinase